MYIQMLLWCDAINKRKCFRVSQISLTLYVATFAIQLAGSNVASAMPQDVRPVRENGGGYRYCAHVVK